MANQLYCYDKPFVT